MSDPQCGGWANFLSAAASSAAFASRYRVFIFMHDTSKAVGFDGSGNAHELGSAIDKVFPNGQKFGIIAHSRGGLVARAYMNTYSNGLAGDRVFILLTLGTPHHGSPLAIPDWGLHTLSRLWFHTVSVANLVYNVSDSTNFGLETRFNVNRQGDVDLGWDNFEAPQYGIYYAPDFGLGAPLVQRLLALPNPHTLSVLDANSSSSSLASGQMDADLHGTKTFGTLNELNENDRYLLRITAYGGYYSNICNNADVKRFLANLDDQHVALSYVATILAEFASKGSNLPLYYHNDGAVPLQSALFLESSPSDEPIYTTAPHSFYGPNAGSSALANCLPPTLKNISARTQVQRVRLFPELDHSQLKDSLFNTVRQDVDLEASSVDVPVLSVSTPSLDFGSVSIGSSAQLSLILRNTGFRNLNVFDISSPSSDFQVQSSPLPIGIAPYEEVSVAVSFAPAIPGIQQATLTISTNASASLISISLTGTGLPTSPAPPSCSLGASPRAINAGDFSTLSWTTNGNPTSASIDNGIGTADPAGGSLVVSPSASTTYTMTVANGAGSGTCAATVMVNTVAGCTWKAGASLPSQRANFGVGVINDVIYAYGGVSDASGSVILDTMDAYDVTTGAWTSKSPLTTARAFPVSAVVNGAIYAIGGCSGFACSSALRSVELYDPVSDTWTSRAPMPTPRYGLGVGAVNGVIYAVGGDTNPGGSVGNIVGTVEAYDPVKDIWTTKASMPTPRRLLAVAVIGGILYAIGGRDAANRSVGTVEAYDPSTNTWITVASMPTPRAGLAAQVVNGSIYVVGGFGTDLVPFPAVEAYSPTNNSWIIFPPLPTARGGLGVAVVGSDLYALGGAPAASFASALGTVEVLNTACPTSQPKWVQRFPGNFAGSMWFHKMAYDAARGETVLFGGAFLQSFNFFPLLDQTWVWNGANWTMKAVLGSPAARVEHAMTYDTTRGETLLFGGNTGPHLFFVNLTNLDDTWTWDGMKWTERTPTNRPLARRASAMAFHRATKEAILFGGLNDNCCILGDTWAWDGVNWTPKSTPVRPLERFGHAMAYDVARRELVLFGGLNDSVGFLNDTWVWDGQNWIRKFPANSPPASVGHALAYDEASQQIVLLGGTEGSGSVFGNPLDGTWSWDGSNWVKQFLSPSPSPRSQHAMTYDSGRREVVVYGGASSPGLLRDTWVMTAGPLVEVTTSYLADALPPDSSPAWARFQPACPMGTPDTTAGTISGGILEITDFDTSCDHQYRRFDALDSNDDLEMEWRLAVSFATNPAAVGAGFSDGTKSVGVGHTLGSVVLFTADPVSGGVVVLASHALDASQFHNYKLVKNADRSIMLVVDGNKVLDVPYHMFNPFGGALQFFGAGSNFEQSQSFWDSVTYIITRRP